MSDGPVLRPATPADLEFLYGLLRQTLGPYVEQTWGPWDDEDQRARFFSATRLGTQRVVELDGRPTGCVDVDRLPDAFTLNRVLLLPEHQNRGLGSQLVGQVLSDAREAGLPVRLRVLRVNPARRLYQRLGFAVTGETETHVEMEHAG